MTPGTEEGIEQDIETVETSLGIARLSAPQQEQENNANAMNSTNIPTPAGEAVGSSTVGETETDTQGGVESFQRVMAEQAEEEKILTGENAVELDLSAIRGIQPPEEQEPIVSVGIIPEEIQSPDKKVHEQDLEALAELVPGLIKTGKSEGVSESDGNANAEALLLDDPSSPNSSPGKRLPHLDSMMVNQGIDEEYEEDERAPVMNALMEEGDEESEDSDGDGETSDDKTTNDLINSYEKRKEPINLNESSSSDSSAGQTHASDTRKSKTYTNLSPQREGQPQMPNPVDGSTNPNPYKNVGEVQVPTTPARDADESYYGTTPSPGRNFHHQSSADSLTTATQATQANEMRMPMYLPNFRPATGCTNASDFIVRCFVARLRAGITVVKHGRSRWCKSRLRVLHVHSDGRSLSWRPAQGEPSSNKRPPKLDLSTCLEVRHAWSPDPLNPMFTGTPILRSKCEATNAFKSFALIFPRRTVDITAVTADQCKVLMEGFSALCFRLQVANMAGRGPGRGMVNGEVNDPAQNRVEK